MLQGEDQVRMLLKQYRDTKKIVSTTLKPDIFFGRLNFLYDVLLSLQRYENIPGMFTKNDPTQALERLKEQNGRIVSDFITRYMENTKSETKKKKTLDGMESYYEKSMTALIAAFDCANTFWEGNRVSPHYTGGLFTKENYDVVQALWDEFCDNDFSTAILEP